MRNQINIDDTVIINMPGSYYDKAKAVVESMSKMSGEIYYNGKVTVSCVDNPDNSYETTAQFKEGQYIIVEHIGNSPDIISDELKKERENAEENLDQQENISETEM